MTATRTTTTLTPVVDYPSSDGRPMAESDAQRTVITYAVEALDRHFHPQDEVYVSGNLLIYYDQGSRRRVAPDVFVVRGAPKHRRPSYLLWQEPKAPDWVLEVTSRSTRRTDQGRKRDLYAQLGVQEYWLYDPTGDYLNPPLQGLELQGGVYQPMALREMTGGVLSGHSPVLGLELRLDQGELRFHDPATGQTLRTYQESEAGRQEVEGRLEETETRLAQEARARQQEARARQQAEARVGELEARLRALEGPSDAP